MNRDHGFHHLYPHPRSLLGSRPHLEVVTEPLPIQAHSRLHDAANQSDRRGVIYWFNSNPRRSLLSYDHQRIRQKVEKLMENVGLAERIPSGAADLAGSLKLRLTTADSTWNDIAEAAYEARNTEPVAFEWSERFDYRSIQWQLNRNALAFGDMLHVRAGERARFFEAWQIRNHGFNRATKDRPRTDQHGQEWHEGVLVNRNGAHRAYNLIDPTHEEETFDPVPAHAAYYYAKLKRPGRVRGLSILAGAVNKIQDLTENAADVMSGIKARNQLGYFIATNDPADPLKGRTLQDLARQDVKLIRKDADGNLENVQVRYEDLLTHGGAIPSLPPGTTIETLAHNQPGQNEVAFWAFLVRDIWQFSGIPPEALWDMAGMHGANVRWITEITQRWIDQHHQTCQFPWLRWHARHELALMQELGEIPRGPANWWHSISFLAPRRWTVDRGREGSLNLEELQLGYRSRAKHAGEQGEDWKPEALQIIEEEAWIQNRCRERGVDPETLHRQLPGAPASPTQPTTLDEAHPEPAPATTPPPGV